MQRIYRLPETLDTAALLAAFRHVVSTHDALRMRLVCDGGEWRQRFTDSTPTINGINVEGGTPEQRERFAFGALLGESAEALDLERDPPISAAIARVDGRYLFALTVDHLAADDTAFDLIERELERAYRQLRDDADPSPTSEQASFRAYLARERERAAQVDALPFWLNVLRDAPLAPATMRMHWVEGRQAAWALNRDDAARLYRACRALACSPFVALLAAQVIVLARLGGDLATVVNLPVSKRVDAVDQQVIGNLSLLTHLPVRLDLDEALGGLLQRLRDLLLAAMKHRYYDYPVLSDWAGRDAHNRGGIAHWMIGCSYLIDRQAEGPGLLTRVDPPLLAAPQVPNGSFALSCRQRPDEISLAVVYDPAAWPISDSELPGLFRALLAALERPATIVRNLLS